MLAEDFLSTPISPLTPRAPLLVGIGMLVALACIAGMYFSVEMRLKTGGRSGDSP